MLFALWYIAKHCFSNSLRLVLLFPPPLCNAVVLIMRNRPLSYNLYSSFYSPLSLVISFLKFTFQSLRDTVLWVWGIQCPVCTTTVGNICSCSLLYVILLLNSNKWVVVTQEGYTGSLWHKLKLQSTGRFFFFWKASVLLLRPFNWLWSYPLWLPGIISLT